MSRREKRDTMPIVHPCAAEGCNTLTMGELCLDCERRAAAQAPVLGKPGVRTERPSKRMVIAS